jgi:uncharacterized protein
MTEKPDGQEEVFAFLADPLTYGYRRGGSETVRRIDTHAASVFLAGARALKIKRTVRFSFLDYSTLEKRKAACEAELAVNARYAPEIYRGILAITREADGALALQGNGTPVEWAVDMHRFDETSTLDNLADTIDESLAEALGRAVAAAHAQSPVVEAGPWIDALKTYLDQNLSAFRDSPALFEPDAVTELDRQARDAYARIGPLLLARGRMGRVRRCHGDLHLGNIALIDGRPVLFDAVEFDPLIATGDVLYDLAFLLMDLCNRNRVDAANIVLNRYLVETRCIEDLDGLAALPFFLSLRAAIRAKVTAARLNRAEANERPAIAQAARRYFALSRRAIAPPTPGLLALGGLSGTGKTRLARKLAPDVPPLPGAVILRSDIERKALFGAAETAKLPESAYAGEVTRRVYATLNDKARRIVSTGHSAIVDAVFANRHERDDLAAAAKSIGARLQALFLTASLDARLARLRGRSNDASDADEAVARAQERFDLGQREWEAIDASGSVEETLTRALAVLGLSKNTTAPRD